MQQSYKLIAFSGSLRKASTNTGLLRAAQELSGPLFSVEIQDISAFPFYNGDVDSVEQFPEIVKEVRQKILESNGIIFSVCEYNHSISGVLKNAIDWLSRSTIGPHPFSKKTSLFS